MLHTSDRINLGSSDSRDVYVTPSSNAGQEELFLPTGDRSQEVSYSAAEIEKVCMYLYASGRDVLPPRSEGQAVAASSGPIPPSAEVVAYQNQVAVQPNPAAAETGAFNEDHELDYAIADGLSPREAELTEKNRKALQETGFFGRIIGLASIFTKRSPYDTSDPANDVPTDAIRQALDSDVVGQSGVREPLPIDVIATATAQERAGQPTADPNLSDPQVAFEAAARQEVDQVYKLLDEAGTV
jgi:hypothetical protein